MVDGAIDTDWEGYEPYEPPVPGASETMTRLDAKRVHEFKMLRRFERIEMVRSLARRNGISLDVRGSTAIRQLNEWYVHSVEPDGNTPGTLSMRWVSVTTDIGLLLGEELIGRAPELYWDLFVWGRSNISFQRSVVMGFKAVKGGHPHVDFERRVSACGHRAIASRGSIGHLGTAEVRGVDIDLDVIQARHTPVEVTMDEFENWILHLLSRV